MRHALCLDVIDLAPRRAGGVVATGVTFALAPGEALVLRGANGSGKTSVLRAVAGLAAYDGTVSFGDDADPAEARAKAVHMLGGGDGLSDKMSAAEHVRFWQGLYGTEGGTDALAAAGLAGSAHQAAGRLSTGQRRRLGLSRLVMAPKPLWLLDEPYSGLDADGRSLLDGAIDRHRAEGGLVLLATHEAQGISGAPVLRLG